MPAASELGGGRENISQPQKESLPSSPCPPNKSGSLLQMASPLLWCPPSSSLEMTECWQDQREALLPWKGIPALLASQKVVGSGQYPEGLALGEKLGQERLHRGFGNALEVRNDPLPLCFSVCRSSTMRLPLIWALLLFPAGSLAQDCPADCQCNQPQTVFCIARSSPAVPQRLPPDTAHLYMFDSGLRTLSEDSFAGLPALRLLDLSQNLLSRLPRNVFQPLLGLHNLDLSSNQLREVTNESFHGLRLLERLYLDRNQLQVIHPAAFNSLENLLELKLQDNQLHTVPPLNLPTLLLLDISRNTIAALETGTLHVRSLESLKMAGLGLGSLDEELLRSLRHLHELDVSDNLLARVPTVLSRLPGLTRLSLAGNALISQLRAEDFRQLQQLQELDISNLNLQGLPWDFFASFPRLRAVTAAENPFNCVCPMSWMVSWARLSKASLRRPEETRCHFPPKNAGRLLQQLEYTDFGCPTTTASPSPLRATSPQLPSPQLPSSRPLPPGAGPAHPTAWHGGFTASPALEGGPSPEARPCPPHACLNGGLCQPGPNRHLECLCPPGFTGLYCEVVVGATPPLPQPTQAQQIAVKHVGSTSIQVGLQNYIGSKPQLKGIRLTYWNLSGPDKRPVTLSLPATLPEYTVRALKPNSSYHLCVGALGDKAPQEELCVEAHTLHPTHQQQHAPVTQSRGHDLPLVVAPSVAAGLLLLGVAVASSCYARQRRRQRKAQAAPGTPSVGPLELEGGAMSGEKGGLVTQSPKTAAPLSLEYEVPLMQPHFTSTAPPRALGPSYF